MDDFELRVGGLAYKGWKNLRVSSSLDQLAPSFDFEYFHQWAYNTKPVAVLEGSACSLHLGSTLILTGYVHGVEIAYDGESLTFHATGAARTIDLVEASAVIANGSLANQTALQIAQAICRPFGISVSVASGVSIGAAFPRFSVQQGESAFEALERACRMRGVFPTTTPTGNLLLTRSGNARTSTTIERGVNVLSGRRSATWSERFSSYKVLAQAQGTDDLNGADAAHLSATASDPVVSRYRPLLLVSEQQEPNREELAKRALWEATVRAARGARLTYTVPGWRNAEGPWRVNQRVRVVDPVLRVNRELLVWSVSFERSTDADTTTLELVGVGAASPEPLQPQPDRGSNFL